MNDTVYVYGGIALVAAGTFLMRALPFLAGRWLTRERWIRHMGLVLPLAIMVLLILQTAYQSAMSYEKGGIAEILSLVLTFILQWNVKNSLLSIFSGAALYVVLRNMVIF